jgi:hypothetical protein
LSLDCQVEGLKHSRHFGGTRQQSHLAFDQVLKALELAAFNFLQG